MKPMELGAEDYSTDAWALARGASKKTKLLAQGENLRVPYNRTGVILSPDSSFC